MVQWRSRSGGEARDNNGRDPLVTGMGFCLPGDVYGPADLWSVSARGRTTLARDGGLFHGSVHLTPEEFAGRVPELPAVFAAHLSGVQRFALVALVEACADAKLDIAAGDLSAAAVLPGRGSIDHNVPGYTALLDLDPRQPVSPERAMALFLGGEMTATPADVAMVQGALTRTTGPCFTASAGCASSSVQLNTARLLIAAGVVDLAVVTGVDAFNLSIVRNSEQLISTVRGTLGDALELPPGFDALMRPYDRRAGSINFGEGAATLVLESREHAQRRGAHAYGKILSHALTRDGLPHPLTGDPTGAGLAAAVRQCLGSAWPLPRYVHGGSDGDEMVTSSEAGAMRELYGEDVGDLLLSSHEGSFGHNGAAAGTLGLALTLLMMERGEVCPTANCEQPADGIPFDPVPGTSTRPLEFDQALVLSYQMGGVKSVVLVGSER